MGNQNNQNNDIIIDDGSKVYNIRDKHGKLLGKFVFRPSDTGIVNRYEEVAKFFNNLQLPDNSEETMRAAEKELVEQVSYLIGADAQEAFFDILSPFSPLASGELFVENVLTAIANVIEKEFKVRSKKVQRRMNKYVTKYHR